MSAERVVLGVVVGAHGVRGAIRLKSFTADPAAIGDYGPVEDEAGQRRFRLRVLAVGKDVVTVAIDGVTDRDGAEALKGTRLCVPRAALPATADEDEFYHADLLGLTVETAAGALLGKVAAIHDFGAGTMVEVTGTAGGSVLLPFTRAVVPVIDLAGRRLVVEPPAETEARPEGGE